MNKLGSECPTYPNMYYASSSLWIQFLRSFRLLKNSTNRVSRCNRESIHQLESIHHVISSMNNKKFHHHFSKYTICIPAFTIWIIIKILSSVDSTNLYCLGSVNPALWKMDLWLAEEGNVKVNKFNINSAVIRDTYTV